MYHILSQHVLNVFHFHLLNVDWGGGVVVVTELLPTAEHQIKMNKLKHVLVNLIDSIIVNKKTDKLGKEFDLNQQSS